MLHLLKDEQMLFLNIISLDLYWIIYIKKKLVKTTTSSVVGGPQKFM